MDHPLIRGLIVFAAAALAAVGVLIVRRLAPPEKLRENNDFTGFTYAFVGLVSRPTRRCGERCSQQPWLRTSQRSMRSSLKRCDR